MIETVRGKVFSTDLKHFNLFQNSKHNKKEFCIFFLFINMTMQIKN
jgi:hypothetical protein